MTLTPTGLGIGVLPNAQLHVSGSSIVTDTTSVGGSQGSSNLNVQGAIGMSYETTSTNSTLGEHSIVFADSSTGNLVLTLPDAVPVPGRMYRIKKITPSNNVSVIGTPSLDSEIGIDLGSGTRGYLSVVSNGTEWLVLGKSTNTSIATALPASPLIVSLIASDLSETSGVTTGDNLYFIFDGATNIPEVSSKGDVDNLIDFGSKVLGSNYEGYWNPTGNLLTITVLDGTGATLAGGDTLTIKASGSLKFQGDTGSASTDSEAIDGNFSTFKGVISSVDWTPSVISTLIWLDASDTSTISDSGGTVTSWQDKNGNGYDLGNNGDPQSGSDTINGLNVITFDGNDQLEDSFTIPASGNVSFLIIARIDGINHTADSLFSIDGTNDLQFDSNDGSTFEGTIDFVNSGSDTNFSGGPYTGPNIFGIHLDFASGNAQGYVDGNLRADGPATYTSALSTSQTLKIFTNRNGNRDVAGLAGEFIALEDVTDTTRENLEGYLAHKWGLEGSLPPTHPYALSGPTTSGNTPIVYETTRNFPFIETITAYDGGSADDINVGDNIIFVFSGNTNKADVSSTLAVNNLIDFGGYSYGAGYTGAWNSDGNTLTLTVSDNTGANLLIGQTISLRTSGNLKFDPNPGNASNDSGTLTGTFYSSDWTPDRPTTQIFPMEGWWDASETSTITFSSSPEIEQWDDKSGNDRHFNHNGTGRPSSGSRSIFGKNVLDFNGDRIDTGTFFVTGNINTLMVVTVADTFPNTSNRLLSSPSTGVFNLRSNGNFTSWMPSEITHSAGLSTGSNLLLGITLNGSTITGFLNGSEGSTTSFTSSLTQEVLYMGTHSNGSSNPYDGAIAEFIIFPGNDVEDRQRVEGYLAWKWGMQNDLPVTHPYKNQPPK